MTISRRKITLLLLLLTYLSGRFTLSRLQLGIDLEVKYIIFVFFMVSLILPGRSIASDLGRKYKLNNATTNFVAVTFLYFLLSLLSVYYSSNQSLAMVKFVDILFLILLLLGTLYTVNKFDWDEYINFVAWFFIIVGIAYALPVILSSIVGQGRGSFSLGGPNVTTRILFFASISSIYIFITKNKIRYLLLIVLFLGSIVVLGSRGGMIGAVVSLFVLFVVKKVFRVWRIKKNPSIKVKHVVYSLIGIGAFSLIYDRVKSVFLNRFINLTFGGEEIYTSGRDVRYEASINMIKERPFFGHGLNGYDVVTGLGYPHNIALELMNDIGIMGLVFFIGALLLSVILIFKMKNSLLYVFSVLPLYMIIVHMFSGDIYDFRYYFFWIIPLIHYGAAFSEKPNPMMKKLLKRA